jgi:hypothetical protein
MYNWHTSFTYSEPNKMVIPCQEMQSCESSTAESGCNLFLSFYTSEGPSGVVLPMWHLSSNTRDNCHLDFYAKSQNCINFTNRIFYVNGSEPICWQFPCLYSSFLWMILFKFCLKTNSKFAASSKPQFILQVWITLQVGGCYFLLSSMPAIFTAIPRWVEHGATD